MIDMLLQNMAISSLNDLDYKSFQNSMQHVHHQTCVLHICHRHLIWDITSPSTPCLLMILKTFTTHGRFHKQAGFYFSASQERWLIWKIYGKFTVASTATFIRIPTSENLVIDKIGLKDENQKLEVIIFQFLRAKIGR